jgi:Cu(I)/Ag(I) efflux system membrane fusion protein
MTRATLLEGARRHAALLAALGVLAILAVVFRAHLIGWFGGGGTAGSTDSDRVDHSQHGSSPTAFGEASRPKPAAVTHTFSEEGRAGALAGLDAYEAVRAALAADRLEGLEAAGKLVAAGFRRAAAAETDAPAELSSALQVAATAADELAGAATLEAARAHFSELSRRAVAITAADPALAEGRHVFECPMTEGYPRWIQPSDEMANPYMGQEMLTCGSEKDWTSAPPPAAVEHDRDPDEISHYTCSMHPWVRQDDPRAKCPVCGMDLTPVTKEEVKSGIIRIDRERRQAFGVTTQKVERRRLTVPVRASGRVAYDERGLFDVTLKYKGWVERLHVEETGVRVKKGQPLLSVYSPEMFAAQHELILAAQQKKSAATEMQRSRAEALLMGSRKRMRLWDLGPAQIDRIIARGEPLREVPVRSPASGYVIEKDVVEGAAVEPGQRLFRIADLSRIWVEAEIYERDIPLVEKGQAAKVTLSHRSGQSLLGSVSFIHPTIDPRTRTARVRIELENRELELKPDMFAEIDIAVDLGERLVIPEPAVLYSGPRRIVFVDIGEDRLRPTVVETGAKSEGLLEVLSGLEAGDEVVVSGNFLVAAESRLKSATGIW